MRCDKTPPNPSGNAAALHKHRCCIKNRALCPHFCPLSQFKCKFNAQKKIRLPSLTPICTKKCAMRLFVRQFSVTSLTLACIIRVKEESKSVRCIGANDLPGRGCWNGRGDRRDFVWRFFVDGMLLGWDLVCRTQYYNWVISEKSWLQKSPTLTLHIRVFFLNMPGASGPLFTHRVWNLCTVCPVSLLPPHSLAHSLLAAASAIIIMLLLARIKILLSQVRAQPIPTCAEFTVLSGPSHQIQITNLPENM